MPGDELLPEHRAKLDGIVQQMTDNKEPEENIRAVVEDFKSKYLKKKEPIASPLPSNTATPANAAPSVPADGMLGSVNTGSGSPSQTANLQGSITTPETPFEVKEPNLLTGESNEIKNVSKIPEPLPYKQFAKDATRIKYDQEQAAKSLKHEKGGITDRFLAGANHLAANISEAPAMLWNTAAAITDPIAHAFGAEGTGAVQQENKISKHFKDAEEYINDVKPKEHNKGSLEYLKEGKLADTFSALGDEVAESLPASLGLMMGGAAGAGMKGTAALGTLVFGADKQAQLDADPKTKDLPELQKKAIALGNGFAEVLFEGNMGISKLGALTKKVLEKSGKEAAEKFAKEGFEKIYAPAAKQWVGIGAENMVQEAGTQFAQNVIDKYWGVDPNKNLTDGVAQAALQGLGAHMMTSTAPTLLDVARTKSAADKAHKIIDAKNAIKQDLASENVAPETKIALHDKLRKLNEEESDLHKEETQKHEALPDEKKAEVDGLLDKAHKLTTTLVDPSISETTRDVMNKELSGVEKQIEKVYEDNKPKEITPEEKVNSDFEKSFLDTLKPKKEVAQETPVSTETIKPIEDATKKGKLEQNNIEQHQNGDQSGKTESTSGSNIAEQSGEIAQEVKTPASKETTAEQQPEITSENKSPVSPSQEEVTTPKKEKAAVKQELIDEEEQIDAKKEDDKDAIKKLNDDIAILKTFNDKDVSSKKFKAIIERAFKMKEEGKISKPTYTKYRNIASQVLGPKINLDAEEAKYKVESLKEEVKKKLLGEGYKKVIMSAPGLGPKQVADLIDLTAKLTNHAIDAGYAVKEAIEKALEHIKTHPHYNKLIEGGHLDEKEFSKQVRSAFETVKEPAETGKTKTEGEPDITGEKREHSIGRRTIENEKKFQAVADKVKEKGIQYSSLSERKAGKVINDIIKSFDKENLVVDLADEIINTPLDEDIAGLPWGAKGLLAAKVFDKLNTLIENETNDMVKNATIKKAGELHGWWMETATKTGQFNGLANTEIAKTLPASKEALREFAKKETEKLQDALFTKEEREAVEKATSEIINSQQEDIFDAKTMAELQTMVTKEIERISEKVRGKEKTEKMRMAAESLMIDLKDC